ncbi:allophanate hydrolase [Loktanella sp. D2R18]|uniref:5-oxoprolinase subunit B family protein n=1 Tax=Rhodobacterales TaxID=204455 RepID=UPI000DE9BCB8|nr:MULTISPECIES: carboxyltransferase domain-containing protein [Rhodobacterales]MDO6592088.1 carboxyltransferase domain-containing protein [Yoonia sp. 1_MG-2023]RBW43103.1 allophanate hydrolase [Loktanella sp. D2R18]
MTDPEICPLGVDGVLIRFARTLTEAANTRAIAFARQVKAAALQGVTEVASSLTSVRVGFDPALTDRANITTQLTHLLANPAAKDSAPHRLWQIPVAFGPDHAPQLAEAAALAGVTQDQAIAEITTQKLRVIALGFAPGQPYLGMLPQHWDIPRQSKLTPQMPNGALVVAVRQLIIFAADAPTGWRHIGQSAFQVYQPDAAKPFAFQPGDTVQFCAVGDAELTALQNRSDTNGGAQVSAVT